MSQLKYYDGSSWVNAVVGAQGQTGSPGVVSSGTAPSDTSILWADTSATGNNAIIPAGGTTGQALVKTSSTDYATQWATPGGGADNFTLIGSYYNPTSITSFTISDLPAKNMLFIRVYNMSSNGGSNGLDIQFNSAGNYNTQTLRYSGSTQATPGYNDNGNSRIQPGKMGSSAGDTVNVAMIVFGANSTGYQPYQYTGVGSGAGGSQTFSSTGTGWMSAGVITSVTFYCTGGNNFDAGEFEIYGA